MWGLVGVPIIFGLRNMFRALIELIVTIIIAMAARAILGSVMKGFANSARTGFSQGGAANTPPQPPPPQRPRERESVAGELHKDPVCGTYVAESTQFQRRSGRENFYYCSEACKDKHALAAR
jgi:YHS domain-containing protein